jgi:hypothetical protein
MSRTDSFTKDITIATLLVVLLLCCFALSPKLHAVTPAPDGGYPGGNTAEGIQALQSLTAGTFNTAIGQQALFSNTTGSYNTAEGFRALVHNTTGPFNTATGVNALYSNTTAQRNVADGFGALFKNTTGSGNVALGSTSLYNTLISNGNTATGDNTLYNNTGGFNVANGSNALFNNTTGVGNVGIGTRALYSNTTGSSNIALGGDAGLDLTTGDNNIAIGNRGVAGDSGFIRIGTAGTHTTMVLGADRVAIGTDNPTQAKFVVSGIVSNAQNVGRYFDGSTNALTDLAGAGHSSYSIFASARIAAISFDAISDARVKCIEGRSDAAGDLNTLMKIEVTNYKFKDTIDHGKLPQKKVIGQQVEQVYPQAVNQHTDVVPDIYKQATVKDGWVQLASDLKVGERVRLIGMNEEGGVYQVLEVTKSGFRTDFKPDGDKVFVYGREVNDARTVDYEAVAMLNVSATQELARKLVTKDAEIDRLAAKLAQQQKELETVVARLKEQESKIQKVSAQLEVNKAAPRKVVNNQ